LIKHVLAEDYTLVTVNAQDFRGSGDKVPGGLYATIEMHTGLICLNSDRRMDLNAQRELFQIALEELAGVPDLINRVLEVTEEASGEVVVTIYELSSPEQEARNVVQRHLGQFEAAVRRSSRKLCDNRSQGVMTQDR
jgi:hypothetical protein